jgi:transcriptional regulator with XRE-family HTH domain
MQSIGGKISSLRKSEGLTQEQFATEIGVSKPSLVKFEKGNIDIIPLGVAIKMAKVLNENFGQLFEIEGCQFASAEQEALIKVLQDSETFLENRVVSLEKRILEKDLVIESLKTTRNFLISEFIKHIETRLVRDGYWVIKQGYKYAKTDEEKSMVKDWIDKYDKERKGRYDNFVVQGLLTQTEIDQHLNEINSIYENQNLEQAFKHFFSER